LYDVGVDVDVSVSVTGVGVTGDSGSGSICNGGQRVKECLRTIQKGKESHAHADDIYARIVSWLPMALSQAAVTSE